MHMCVKLPPRDLNPGPWPHTPQIFILVKWPSHQGCAVVDDVSYGWVIWQWHNGKITLNTILMGIGSILLDEFYEYLDLICQLRIWKNQRFQFMKDKRQQQVWHTQRLSHKEEDVGRCITINVIKYFITVKISSIKFSEFYFLIDN